MATLAKNRISQASHQFKGGIQNNDHGAQFIGNYNFGGDFNFTQSSGQDYQERLRACRHNLHSGRSDPQDDRTRIIAVKTKTGRIIETSCEWIITHNKYRSWEDESTSSKLLWISSAGEHGKTMMAIYLSQVLERATSRNKDSTVLYFFIDRQKKKDTAADVLCGLLIRLLRAKNNPEELIKHLFEEYELQKDALFRPDAIEALWRVFVKMVTDPAAGQIYCIIDGLDYCTEDSLRRLVNRITNFFLGKPPGIEHHLPNTYAHDYCSSGPLATQEPPEQEKSGGLKMILVGRDKPEWLAEQLSEFARIDIGARGRKDGALSRHSSRATRRQRTLASVVADVIRKQRLEKLINHDEDDQPFAFDIQTGLPATTGNTSNYAVPTHRKRALLVTDHHAATPLLSHEPSLLNRSPTVAQEPDAWNSRDLQTSCGATLINYEEQSDMSGPLSSQMSAFEVGSTPWGDQDDQTSPPPLPPRPQSHSHKTLNDRYEQDNRVIGSIMVEDEEIEENHGRKALRLYIRTRLQELIAERHWPTEIQASLVTAIEHCGDDTFLWVDFAVEEIRNAVTDIVHLETVLGSLPPTMTEMYSYILLKIPKELTTLAAGLLHWSVGALRPLTILELTVALDLTIANQDAATNLVRAAVSACGNMLTINEEDETVNIVHISLVDFLSTDSSRIHRDARLAQFVVRTSKNHGIIAKSCIAYLESGCFREGAICRGEDEVVFHQRQAQFPFMNYAWLFWMDHLQHVDRPFLDLSSPFFQSKSKLRKSWWHTYWAAWTGGGTWLAPMNFTLLHLAARFDLVCIAEQLLRHGDFKERVDKRDSHGYTPLEYSVIDGRMQMFQFLTAVGATHKGAAETLLELACRAGNEYIAEALIENGSDVNLRAQRKSVKESIYRVTKFLPGTIVEKTGWKVFNHYFGDHETPLVIAAMYGHAAVVAMLLEHGASVDAGTTKGFTPLHAAADQGRTECVEILLKCGANIVAHARDEWLALHFAAWRGRLSVLRIFLDMGVPLEAMTVKSKTALHLSAYGGHAEVVRALVDRGANLELKSYKGETPLHLATRSAKPQVVELLLSLGARREALTSQGKTSRELAQASHNAEGEECLRILETFGSEKYRHWQPPEGSDAPKMDDSVKAQSSRPLKPAQLDSMQISLCQDSQLQAEYPSTAVRSLRQSPPPTLESSRKCPQYSWHDPPATSVSDGPDIGCAQVQHQESAHTMEPRTVTEQQPRTSLVQMINSMSLSCHSSPSMQSALPGSTPCLGPPRSATSVTTSPYTQSSHLRAQSSAPSIPTISTPVALISPPTHTSTACRSRPLSSPIQPPQTEQLPDRFQQRFSAQHRSQTVPIIQPQPCHPPQQQYALVQALPSRVPQLQQAYSSQQQQYSPPHHPQSPPQNTYPPPQQPFSPLQQPFYPSPQPYFSPQQPYSHVQPPHLSPQPPYQTPPQLHYPGPPQQPQASPPTQPSPYFGDSTASTYSSTYEYSAPPVMQPYNPGLGINGNSLLFAPPPTQEQNLKKRKSFLGGLLG